MSDNNPDYDKREQSEIKHHALRYYLEAATRILGGTRHLKYVDCCAGPWEAAAGDFSDTSFGLATKALTEAAEELAKRGLHPSMACLFIEKKVEAFRKLDDFAKAHDTPALRIRARNWDFSERTIDIVNYCSGLGSFPFLFIDPTGWQLAGLSVITPLLKLNPGEVLINLMSSFIARFIKDNKTDFSDLLGDDFPKLRELKGPELESAIITKYCEIVKNVGGYDFVCSLPVMNPDLDTFTFHLIYATRHPRGVAVFKDAEKRVAQKTHEIRAQLQQRERETKSGNLELFDPAVQYRENSYQRLSRKNNARAHAAVEKLLKSNGRVSYDSCWQTALQFSTVYEPHLRFWISAWESSGNLVVHGKTPRARVLQIAKNISLQWIGEDAQ